MDNQDRKIFEDNNFDENESQVNDNSYYEKTDYKESVNESVKNKNNAFSKLKNDNKNRLIVIVGIILISLILFFILNRFVFSKTSEGFPKGKLLEQQFSPNNADVMRVYGDTDNPVTSTFIRIEVESVQNTRTVYYQESINPANVDYDWSSDSDSIIVNGVNYDKNITFNKDNSKINETKKETTEESIIESLDEIETQTN